jgi:hypothetical protein
MKFEDIQHRTIDDAGCAIWQGGTANGHPAMRHGGKTQYVRRLLWEGSHGPIPPGSVVHCTCSTPGCVEPSHAELKTRSELGKKLGAEGKLSGITRIAAIARAKRKTYAKLTQQDVDAIRASTDTTYALGKQYGVSQPHISAIKLYKTWRDFSSPWAGL